MNTVVVILAAVLLTPLLGGLLNGVDRRITARLQGRFGPPLLQPFFDVAKLMGKQKSVVNIWQAVCAWVYFCSALLSVVLLVMGSDLLLIFFVLTVGGTFLVAGALASPSPYSQAGGQRELILMLVYETLLILAMVSMAMVAGSFKVSAILALDKPLLPLLPLSFLALGYTLTIKMRKSPFDISSSHHAHQELVKGVLTDYSGPHLGLIEVGHWFETVFLLALFGLFWATSWIGMLLLAAASFAVEILLDNVTSRMTWRWTLRNAWSLGLVFAALNMSALYLLRS